MNGVNFSGNWVLWTWVLFEAIVVVTILMMMLCGFGMGLGMDDIAINLVGLHSVMIVVCTRVFHSRKFDGRMAVPWAQEYKLIEGAWRYFEYCLVVNVLLMLW